MVDGAHGPPDEAMLRGAIAVITYRRPALLADLLGSLQAQELRDPEMVAMRLIVVDNDPEGSARRIIADHSGPYPVTSVIEPDPGIPAARQRSVDLADNDDFVVFVDDDEVVPPGWLQQLLDTWRTTGADVVTGPVHGVLPEDAPFWARHSDIYSSLGRHRTGKVLDKAYTNNTLVSRAVLDAVQPAFHPAFRYTGSSDLHFFLRVARAGFTIVWDNDAAVTETIPASRVSLRWLLHRAFRSGSGDTISRRLISPGTGTLLFCAVLGAARIVNGLALIMTGLLDPARRIKGFRRAASGCGTFAGLFGINYEEYQRR